MPQGHFICLDRERCVVAGQATCFREGVKARRTSGTSAPKPPTGLMVQNDLTSDRRVSRVPLHTTRPVRSIVGAILDAHGYF